VASARILARRGGGDRRAEARASTFPGEATRLDPAGVAPDGIGLVFLE